MDVWRALKQGTDLICSCEWQSKALHLYLDAVVQGSRTALVATASLEAALDLVKAAEEMNLGTEVALIGSGKQAKVLVSSLFTPIDPQIQASIQLLIVDIVDSALSKHFIYSLEAIFKSFPTAQKTLFTDSLNPIPLQRLSLCLSAPTTLCTALSLTLEGTHHYKVDCEVQNGLLETVLELLNVLRDDFCLVYFSRRRQAECVAGLLAGEGMETAVIHEKMQFGRVKAAISDFEGGRVKTLLACDPIHVPATLITIHYGVPTVKQYLMRVGHSRLARRAVSIVMTVTDEEGKLRAIERILGREVEDLPADLRTLL